MCRWITLLSSEPFSLSDIVLSPSNSMVQMSIDASFHPGYGDQNNHVMNGDGFGVGWYHGNYYVDKASHHTGRPNFVTGSKAGEDQSATLHRYAASFKDVLPAWNNLNLREICQATSSDCIMAHVRAASKGTGVSQQNCHPFKAGRLLFCHNGRLDSFQILRRRYYALLSDEAFMGVRGTTDSEYVFALLLTVLAEDGKSKDSPITQTAPYGHCRLMAAVKKVLRIIEDVQTEAGLDSGFNTCNFSLTDGESMVVTRYCNKSPDVPPPSLYFTFGEAAELYEELTKEATPIIIPPTHPSAGDLHSFSKQKSSTGSTTSEGMTDESMHSEDDSDKEDERIKLKLALSTPGRIFADIDPKRACMVVCSTPLTHTHSWHRIPANAILYYTRGSFPELRLLARMMDKRVSVVAI
jgi:glutamine amidotransferase